MTRILYWNINQFSSNNLITYRKVKDRNRTKRRRIPDTQMRDLIYRHFAQFGFGPGAVAADIIVVVEVSTGNVPARGLINPGGGGWQGLQQLLAHLRATDPLSNWNLVPPIVIGMGNVCEGVGVFYKSTFATMGVARQRYFTGPNRISAAHLSFDPTALGAPASAPYPVQPHNNIVFFSAARNIPAGSQYNASPPLPGVQVPESHCAARTVFSSVANPGNNVIFGNSRQPFMCSFFETAGGGAAARNLTLFVVHSPPNYIGARNHITLLADCVPIEQANGVTETKFVLGDFNIALFRNNGTQINAYDPLINGVLAGGNYNLLMSVNPAVNLQNGLFKGYYATHMRSPKKSRFSSKANITRYYPGYGYIGSDRGEYLFSIDNVMVRAPGGGAGGAAISILNSVVGMPMAPPTPNSAAWSRPIPPPVSPPPPFGVIAFGSDMANIPVNVGNPTNAAPVGNARANTGWDDYGHIYATSDHLALVTDI